MKHALKEKYLAAAKDFSLKEAKEEKLLLRLSLARFFSFTGGLALTWFVFLQSKTAGYLLIALVVIIFLYLLKLYSEHLLKKEFFGNLAKINRDEADAISGDYAHFEAGNEYINIHHDFSFDVDLFGKSSVFQYLNRTVTGYGRDILANWLQDPYSISDTLVLRQDTIKELAGKERWRQEFLASGMKTPLEKAQIAGLLGWMYEKPAIRSSLVAKILIWILPAAAILSLLLVAAGLLHYSIFMLFFLGNLFWISIGLKSTNRVHSSLSKKYSYLSSMTALLKMFEKEDFESAGMKEIKLNESGSKMSAAVSVKKLSRLIQSFDSRMNVLVGLFMNGLLLWDYHCIYKLENWKSDYKNYFPGWLEMIGKVDAFISLGNFACNNPEFTYPVISENNIVFSASMAGHPLIDEEIRVCNDFILENKGTVCIITGANMAGKSTFLRTIAVNYILAMAGAPVCASKLEFTPFKLFTSMRTTDSLSDNESYFYAELKRIKSLKTRFENKEPVFFILDEILKGTNSADKSLGSKMFLKRMIELGGTGLIATHDTSVGEMEKEFPQSVFNMCFEIEIEGESIRFEYKLQKGITTKMNAALLMKQMGILD
ncbi:MAG: DNA mismatch repair protein MutS [Bacteroidales bacterium]|nr:DNA mismatch repair protein MutS [Bacteroidales bacterium]